MRLYLGGISYLTISRVFAELERLYLGGYLYYASDSGTLFLISI